MRILVTGGAGFIGSNFVRRTLATRPDTRVTVLDKLTYAANPASLADLDAGRCRLVEGDVCDAALVDDLVADADLVVHFAAESHNDRSLRDPAAFVRTNVEGTVAVLAACARHDVRLHHISTDEVFGDLALDDPARFTPQTPYRPSSPYSASKASADHFVRAWVRSFGLRATISNCSNNYGPRQHPEKFIPRQILRLLSGRPPRSTIVQTYLIGADGEASNLDVVRALNRAFGRAADDFEHVTDRPGHDRRYAIDAASTRALGWTPRHTDLAAGLAATVDWYRANEPWWRAAFDAAEDFYAATERRR